jgi:hypothetical protein
MLVGALPALTLHQADKFPSSSKKSLDCKVKVLKLSFFAGHIFPLTDQGLKNLEFFGAGVDREVGPQDFFLEVENSERLVLKAAMEENLVLLAFVTGKLQV